MQNGTQKSNLYAASISQRHEVNYLLAAKFVLEYLELIDVQISDANEIGTGTDRQLS